MSHREGARGHGARPRSSTTEQKHGHPPANANANEEARNANRPARMLLRPRGRLRRLPRLLRCIRKSEFAHICTSRKKDWPIVEFRDHLQKLSITRNRTLVITTTSFKDYQTDKPMDMASSK